MKSRRSRFAGLLAFSNLVALLPLPLLALPTEAPPWTLTVTPTLNPLPVGLCGAVQVKVAGPAGRDAPRNPLGHLVTLADFDMTVSASPAGTVVGQQVDASHWLVCACQGTAVGTTATVTAKYPGKTLMSKSKVAANSKPLQKSSTLAVAAAKGRTNPPACVLGSTEDPPQVAPNLAMLAPPATRDPFAAAPIAPAPTVIASPDRPVAPPVIPPQQTATTGYAVAATTSFIGHGDIGPAGGVVESTDGRLMLRFPAGAVTANTAINIQNLSAEIPTAARGWRLSPEGMIFKAPVELVISYADEDVEGSAPEALEIGSRKAGGAWSMLAPFALDAKAKTLTIKTTHFSDWSMLEGLQLMPADPIVMIGQSVDLVVNSCILVDKGGGGDADELNSLKAQCEPEQLVLRTADWSVNGTHGGSASVGKIAGRETGTGTYTAPKSKPNPSRVAVSTLHSTPNKKGFKGLLVSNVTVIDAKGWRGWVKYNLSGSQKSDETTLQSTVTTQVYTENTVTGSGSMKFAPHLEAVPGSMIIIGGSGNLTRSSMQRIVATDTQPVCPQMHGILKDIRHSGQAPNPANPLAIVYLKFSGNSYQLRLSSLSGRIPGAHRSVAWGHLLPGGSGTNCGPPVPSDRTFSAEGEFPEHELLVEGKIDPSNPNVIKGHKTFSFDDMKGGNWVKVPGQYQVNWQFQR